MEFERKDKINELLNSRNNGLIKIITGIRRCGKSYLLNTLFRNYLLSNDEFDDEHIVRFAFDKEDDLEKLEEFKDERPVKIRNKKSYIVNSHAFRSFVKSRTKSNEKYLFLFDEIQYLEDFTTTLNSYIDNKNIDVYVTGSNSKFLSSDIATEFRGRGDVIYLSPLTFKDVFDTNKIEKQKLLDEYLIYGGMPLAVLANTSEKKMSYLKTTFEATYKKDILDKIKDSNEKQIRELTNLLSSNIGSLLNPERIKNTFKSKDHIDLSSFTINNYLSLMSDSFLIMEANRYDVKGNNYISTPSKFYFTDVGIRNSIINFRQLEKNHLMENVIYNELIARGYNVDVGSVSFYEANNLSSYSKKSIEIDFVANKGSERLYIQSAYSIEDKEKYEQEIRPLNKINDGFKKIIVVYDDVITHYDDNGYLIIGLANFLLGNEKL